MIPAHQLRSPLLTLAQAAFFKQISLNQAQHALQTGRLPRAYAIDGSEFRPAGAIAVPATELYDDLDERGRLVWRQWQRGDFEIAVPRTRTERPAPFPVAAASPQIGGYVEG